MRYIEFNIDKALKGKIAEIVFERIYQKGMLKELFKVNGLKCISAEIFCEPFRRHHYSSRISKDALIEILSSNEKFIHIFVSQLNHVRESLGLEKLGEHVIKVDTMLDEYSCFLCFRHENLKEVRIDRHRALRLCSNCLNALLEKGLVTQLSELPVWYEIDCRKAEEICNSIEHLRNLRDMFSQFYYYMRLLSLDKQSTEFLYDACVLGSMKYRSSKTHSSKTLARHRLLLKDLNSGEEGTDSNKIEFYIGSYSAPHTVPHSPFDYICVDGHGNKYLIDVKSVWLGDEAVSFSKGERFFINEAKLKGFKVLAVFMKFLPNWKVRLELVEL